MRCPFCGNPKTKVIDSRAADEGGAIRRRRQCPSCGMRFTTFERREKVEVTIIKRNGDKEAYDRKKLANGMYKACNKRNVPSEAIEAAIEEIEEALIRRNEKEVAASEIGDLVMERLKKIDEVAYLRFASVYKRFTDASEFHKELGELRSEETDDRSDEMRGSGLERSGK